MKTLSKKMNWQHIIHHYKAEFFGGITSVTGYNLLLDVAIPTHTFWEWVCALCSKLITTIIWALIGGFVAAAGKMLFEKSFPLIRDYTIRFALFGVEAFINVYVRFRKKK